MKDFHDIFLIVLIIMQKVLTIYASHLNDYNLHDNSTSKLKPIHLVIIESIVTLNLHTNQGNQEIILKYKTI